MQMVARPIRQPEIADEKERKSVPNDHHPHGYIRTQLAVPSLFHTTVLASIFFRMTAIRETAA